MATKQTRKRQRSASGDEQRQNDTRRDRRGKSLPPGSLVAWDRDEKRVIAVADSYAEVMKQAAAAGESEPVIERTPGFSAGVQRRPFVLLEDESAKVLDDIRRLIPNAEQWLDTPNAWFDGRRPRSLLGTAAEASLRYLLRGIRNGISS